MRALALLAATTIGILWVGVAAALHSQQMGGARERAAVVAGEHPGRVRSAVAEGQRGADANLPVRQIFRHSVVPGGVHAPADVVRAMAADPVVAAHYAGVDTRRLQVRKLAQPLLAYVSYRIGNQIHWTGRKLQLAAGELVLTDGTTTLRGRCGNMVSTVRRTPTFAGEPEAVEFEEVIDPGTIDPDPKGIAFRNMSPPVPVPGSRSKSVAIPEPGSLPLLFFAAVGFVALYVFRYRRHTGR